MPQSPTANMNLVLPSDKGDSNGWDSILDTAFGLLDAHDHSAGRGVLVPVAGLNINADLNLGNTHAIANALALDMALVAPASVSTYRNALYASSGDGELHWLTSTGVDVKLTNGTSINASLIGGIGGDYSSVGALLSFVDATDNYIFQQQVGSAVRQYARIASADIDLYEYKANPSAGVPTTRVRHKSPTALAGSYDVTWLTALPSAQSLMMIDNVGQVTASNTLPNNTNITLQGTGYIKRGPTETIQCPLLGSLATYAAGSVTPQAGTPYSVQAISTTAYYPLFGLDFKRRVTQLVVNLSSAPAAAVTYTLAKTPSVGAGGTAFADTALTVSSSSIAAILNNTTVQLDSTQAYWLKIVTDGTTQVRPMTVSITTDVP